MRREEGDSFPDDRGDDCNSVKMIGLTYCGEAS